MLYCFLHHHRKAHSNKRGDEGYSLWFVFIWPGNYETNVGLSGRWILFLKSSVEPRPVVAATWGDGR